MNYKDFLKHELVAAFGCTEPIALAYCAAKAREILEKNPLKIYASLSGNIIKNANSVKVPGTDGRKGIEISIVAGAFLGDASKELEVLSNIDKSKLEMCDELIKNKIIELSHKPNVENLYIDIRLENGEDYSRVIIEKAHTNIILIEKNNKILFSKDKSEDNEVKIDLNFDKIYDFANTVDYKDLKEILDRQIQYNLAIAKEGINHKWGSQIGNIILQNGGMSYYEKLTAYAAAGSDARMSGCELPVVINSGSGNQGITVAVPIIIYCMDNNIEMEKFYRGLIFANLIALYMKQRIGKLSAYCGVVSASCASVCGVAYVKGEKKEILIETLSNGLAVNSGVICDGAKPSCAGKIASSLRNAFLGYEQALNHSSYDSGDGIVKQKLEDTIETVGNIAVYGMKITDEIILKEMLNKK